MSGWGVVDHLGRKLPKLCVAAIQVAVLLGCGNRTSLDLPVELPRDVKDECTEPFVPEVAGYIESGSLTELSGMVASRDYAGLLYAHADSGSSPEIIVFDESGRAVGNIRLMNLVQIDWEDIAIGRVSGRSYYLYVGDIGDNGARNGDGMARESVVVYRFAEPAPEQLSTAATLNVEDWQQARLQYPDVPHDAEAILVDPHTEDLMILTKENSGRSMVFRAPSTAFAADATTRLEPVGELAVGAAGQSSALITGGDISPSGDRVLLRSYTELLLFERRDTWAGTFAATPARLTFDIEPQGEAVTFTADATAWLSGGEQSLAIHRGSFGCFAR